MYTQTEKVNIEPKSYLPVFRISQNDVGRTLKAHLVSDEGTIAIPTSATVTMAGIKPSGLGYTVTGIIDGSDVTFETNAVMTDEAGQIESEIRIVDGETLIGTTNVVLNVEPNPHPDDTTDGQREPLVNEITALLNQITAQADRTEEYSSKVLNMTVSAHESQEPTVAKTEGEVVNLDFGLPRGEKGERGERGEQGEAGKDGKDGLDGKDGKDGINGVTPDFSIGTVTTLEPNESASVTLTGTEEEPVLNFGIPKGAKGEQGEVSLSDLEKIMVTDTASGAIASFPDGSDLLPALSLVANIVPNQSGSGTPSPDNIRPISGWESVETSVCGKNLLPAKFYSGIGYNGAVGTVYTLTDITDTFTETDGVFSKSVSAWGGASMVSEALPNGSYRINIAVSSSGLRLTGYILDAGYKVIRQFDLVGSGTSYSESRTISLTDRETYIALYVASNVSGTIAFDKPQIEVGSTATEYTPYIAPTTHTTSLGRTVYGGTVDVVSGELVVDRAMVDLGTLNWSEEIDGVYSSSALVGLITEPLTNADVPNILCSQYVPASYIQLWSQQLDNSVTVIWATSSAHGKIWIRDSRFTDAQSFKTAMSGVQLCYELSTPTTYTLTPQTINTLSGVNNVWVDSGDCSITYYADTKLYIDKKLGGN